MDFKCIKCKKVFHNRITLDNHNRNCGKCRRNKLINEEEKEQVAIKVREQCRILKQDKIGKSYVVSLVSSEKQEISNYRGKDGKNCKKKKKITSIRNENGKTKVISIVSKKKQEIKNKIKKEIDENFESEVKSYTTLKMDVVAHQCGFNKTYSCPKCPYSTVYRHNLKEHMGVHENEIIKPKPKPTFTVFYRCDTCGDMLSDNEKLIKHLTSHAESDSPPSLNDAGDQVLKIPFKCTKCSYNCLRFDEYNLHLESHKLEKLLVQPESDNNQHFNYENQQLKSHTLEEVLVEPTSEELPEVQTNVCKTCGEVFYMHRFNARDKGFGVASKCEKCSGVNPTSKEEKYCCEVCGRLFTMALLLKHMITHRDRSYKCKLCPAVYRKNCNLKIHMLAHSGIKKFCCELCGRSFNVLFDLKRHQFRHEVKLPVKCEECSQVFCNLKKVLAHLKVHDSSSLVTIEKSSIPTINCTECDAKFIRRGRFVKHLDTHRNPTRRRIRKPNSFCCDKCGKILRWPGDSMRHKLIHSIKLPFKCTLCSQVFKKNARKAYVHMQMHKKAAVCC